MSKYIMRLDDACEKRDVAKWNRMEELLDRYEVKPLVGVIPHCEDPAMKEYPVDEHFWDCVKCWQKKDWTIAMHGYNHVYVTKCSGINPVNARSEFAGLPIEEQKDKIKKGVLIMREHGINPKVFFAPSHTFDENTLIALKEESDIRIISDTIAMAPYSKYGFTFVPQQSGRVRKLPLGMVTFCYHPNMMKDSDFERLEKWLMKYKHLFKSFETVRCSRELNLTDILLRKAYFFRRRKENDGKEE